jgi:hypothetical protein
VTRYTHKFGSYYLEDEHGNILLMTNQVAVAYAEQGFTLLKHGSANDVLAYVKDLESKGAKALFGPIVVATFPRGYPVEKLNRLLDTSGYMEVLLQELEEAP